jgi:hypothetical protein
MRMQVALNRDIHLEKPACETDRSAEKLQFERGYIALPFIMNEME